MHETKTILITGATGFLGSNLLKRLIRENYQIILLMRSSSNPERISDVLGKVARYNADETDLTQIFDNHSIDTILHCATSYGRKEVSPLALLETNLFLPLKLLQLGSKYATSCFINTDTILDKRVSHYSLSKCQFKDWLKTYARDMICVNVALEHFYGPYDDETKFVTYIIRSLINAVDAIDLTRGEQKRDFIYIDDVVDAFMRIIKHSGSLRNGYFSYEIGSSQTIEIREFVTMVKRLALNTHTHLNFGALPYRENEIMESMVDISNIQKLGWEPLYSIEEGLNKTISLEKEHKLP